jgi:hypothetical protein
MRVALGLKAHSGWAALVVIGSERGEFSVLERSRIALIEDAGHEWAGQPYHAADGKPAAQARAIVDRGIAEARRTASKELRAATARMRANGHGVVAGAVLTPAAMPDWSTQEILAVHFRMHKAEGVLYPDALLRAVASCGLKAAAVAEKQLGAFAANALAIPEAAVVARVAALGKSIGPPWGADQKKAAVAAIIALTANGVQ